MKLKMWRAILGIMVCAACTQKTPFIPPPPEVVKFDDAAEISSSYDQKQHLLTVSVRLKDGFHAYATGETRGRPVALRVIEEKGWGLRSPPVLPTGTSKQLGSQKSVVLEKAFLLKASLVEGEGSLNAELDLQVCTHTQCDRPRTYPITLSKTST